MSIAKCLQDLEAHGLANRGTELGAMLQWAKLHIEELTGALAERDANLTALETHNTMLRACIKGMIKVADRKTDEFDAAKALLAAGAAGAAPVPEGWKLVPVEPTPEMCDEGAQAIVQWENGAVWPDSWGITYANQYRKDAMKAYKAMLAAAAPKEAMK